MLVWYEWLTLNVNQRRCDKLRECNNQVGEYIYGPCDVPWPLGFNTWKHSHRRRGNVMINILFLLSMSSLFSSVRYSQLWARDMTPRISCDLSIPWLISLGHLLARLALYGTSFSHAHGPTPCGPITLSCTFYTFLSFTHPLSLPLFHSIPTHDLFSSFLFISVLFLSILLVSMTACDLAVLCIQCPKKLFKCFGGFHCFTHISRTRKV